MKKYQLIGVYITLILVMLVFVNSVFTTRTDTIENTYSELMDMVKNQKINKVTIYDDYLVTKTETPEGQAIKHKVAIPLDKSSLIDKLEANNVGIQIEHSSNSGQWIGLIGSLIFPLFLLIALILMFRSAQSGGSQAMSFGKSKAKMMIDNKVKVTFADVAGIDESKQELEEIVDFLKNNQRYLSLGAKIPKGVLLVGAPGTGKTLMAKAVAGEAGVPFFSISGSDFVEMFVGVGASRVRDLFEQAKKHAPCIVFIDEIDAVGRQRGAGLGGGHDEREQTLNQLLVEMDGFDGTTGIIIIAATNRPDILDNALLRPGRFDRQVVIDRPDILGREKILDVHIKGKPISLEVNMKTLAKRTPGFTGADLSNLINEAALLAARKDKKEIEMEDMEEAIDKIIAGPEKKSRIIDDREKENTAYHEVGHALLSKFLKNCDPLHKVSIIPRGMALGVTMTLPEKDHLTMRKSQLLDQIAMLLGGRIVEQITFGADEITTGAQNDIERASTLARKIVTSYGMSDKLGAISYGKKNEHVFLGRDFGTDKNYSEQVAAMIDEEVKKIIEEQYAYAKQVLLDNKDIVDELAKALLEKETLDKEEVEEIIQKVKAEREGIVQHAPLQNVLEENQTPFKQFDNLENPEAAG
ncbi:MAG TPA: ATP-dependent zinc metalloprotease FtsH [Candidatus Gastranaerophilales bacterium]|nr:ATP-dependent zinc metalloprotease FtsH [Candidatus Gastranaerophilales bacterium]